MARLFTAIELGPQVRERVASRQAELAQALRTGGFEGLRLVRAEQLHLTLVFLGEIADARVPDIVAVMTADLPLPAFDIEFAHCGVFPPHGPPRVLWLGVDGGAGHARSVFEAVAERLESGGGPRERRPFVPHLTLGRWRGAPPGDPTLILRKVGTVAVQRASAVTLFHSRLLPRGPEHRPLAQARLAAPFAALH